MRPNFTPEINLGHIFQAGVLVVSIIGASVTVSWNVRGLQSSIDKDELRIAANEKSIDAINSSDNDFRKEMRGKLEQVLSALGDLKGALNLKQDRR